VHMCPSASHWVGITAQQPEDFAFVCV